MIPGLRSRFAAIALAAVLAAGLPAGAALETDPAALYATMNAAYQTGAAKGWPFSSELIYQSAVFAAGRAYSLFHPGDPNYPLIATLAVRVATQLHYDPLGNDDASLWYVREAALAVQKSDAPADVALATAILAKIERGESAPSVLAAQAHEDAVADAQAFPHDPDALTNLVVANVRAYELTHDAQYRTEILENAANPSIPLARVPDPEYGQALALAEAALAGDGFSVQDQTLARQIAERRANDPDLRTIARVSAIPRDLRLTRTAPADEYFGHLKYSPLGVHNELVRVGKYLDAGWGYRMAGAALQIDSAVEDWQHQYPRDTTLPASILEVYKLLRRVDTTSTKDAATKLRSLLLVQYPDTSQARDLADGDAPVVPGASSAPTGS